MKTIEELRQLVMTDNVINPVIEGKRVINEQTSNLELIRFCANLEEQLYLKYIALDLVWYYVENNIDIESI